MTASYIVRYQGYAENKTGFISHYRNRHAPILENFPGIKSLVLHHAADFQDPYPITPGGNLLIAEMTFQDISALNIALKSPVRTDARNDFENFPTFHGEVTHQAFQSEKVF